MSEGITEHEDLVISFFRSFYLNLRSNKKFKVIQNGITFTNVWNTYTANMLCLYLNISPLIRKSGKETWEYYKMVISLYNSQLKQFLNKLLKKIILRIIYSSKNWITYANIPFLTPDPFFRSTHTEPESLQRFLLNFSLYKICFG